ncbi:MAG: DUF1592 domain-containing protein [Deltaproteobacteria bacterium]|nr:DUF1592 domain-containing protein [Nannocystaceae bacterium]
MLLGSGCYRGTDSGNAADGGTGDGDDGSAGESDGSDTGDPQLPECDATLVSAETPLRRLTKVQYANTVADLLRWAIPGDADAIFEQLQPRLASIPDDVRVQPVGEHLGGFRRLDQAVQQQHVDTGYQVAKALGQAITTPERLAIVAGPCATDADTSNDDACIDDFIDRFGARVLRRPLFDDERAHYRAAFDAGGVSVGTPPEAFVDVVVALMLAPQFMYVVEHGQDPVAGVDDVYTLSDHELASRLSYHFWQTSPDDELLEAAANGELSTDEGYAEQVDRLLANPRAREAIAAFYHEWLWLDDVPSVGGLAEQALYDEFVGDTPIDASTRDNVVRETIDMALHYTFDEPVSMTELMLANRSFATTPDVAAIYGTEVWDGVGEPPSMPQAERVGLLTRASRLVNGTPSTRPIMKGVFIRMAMLCDALPPPPANANMSLPSLESEMTTRERIEAITEQDGSCKTCHASLINPLGYITEGYDALGRYRTEERLFDQQGQPVGSKPVDSSGVPAVTPGDETVIDDPLTLTRAILDSGRLSSCFARHYVRFSFSRADDEQADACMLDELTTRIDDDDPLIEVLRAVALHPTFRRRSFR